MIADIDIGVPWPETLRVMKAIQSEASATCEHPSSERLGSHYDVLFIRCQACGRVFVLQDGRVWSIPADQPPGHRTGDDRGREPVN